MNCCYSCEVKDKKPDKEQGSEKIKYYKQCMVYSLNMKTNNTSVHSSDLVKLDCREGIQDPRVPVNHLPGARHC